MFARTLLAGICLSTAALASGQPQQVRREVRIVSPVEVQGVQPVVVEVAAERGMIGVRLMDAEGGAAISGVMAGGPAAAAGLKAGDLILAVGKQKVANTDELLAAMEGKQAGETVKLQVDREGWRKKVKLELAAASTFRQEVEQGVVEDLQEAELEQLITEYFDEEEHGDVPHLRDLPVLKDAEVRVVEIDGDDEDELEALHGELMELGVDLESLHGKLIRGEDAACAEPEACGGECKDPKSCGESSECEVRVIRLGAGGGCAGQDGCSDIGASKLRQLPGDLALPHGAGCETDCEVRCEDECREECDDDCDEECARACEPKCRASGTKAKALVHARAFVNGKEVDPKDCGMDCGSECGSSCDSKQCGAKGRGQCVPQSRSKAVRQGLRWMRAGDLRADRRTDRADAGWHSFMQSKGRKVKPEKCCEAPQVRQDVRRQVIQRRALRAQPESSGPRTPVVHPEVIHGLRLELDSLRREIRTLRAELTDLKRRR